MVSESSLNLSSESATQEYPQCLEKSSLLSEMRLALELYKEKKGTYLFEEITDDEINEALNSLSEILQRVIFELFRRFNIPFDNFYFFVRKSEDDHFEESSVFFNSGLDDDGKLVRRIGCTAKYLIEEILIPFIKNPSAAKVKFIRDLAHEIYHAHTDYYFKSQHEKTITANKSKWIYNYYLNNGERASRLFEIKYMKECAANPAYSVSDRLKFFLEIVRRSRKYKKDINWAREFVKEYGPYINKD